MFNIFLKWKKGRHFLTKVDVGGGLRGSVLLKVKNNRFHCGNSNDLNGRSTLAIFLRAFRVRNGIQKLFRRSTFNFNFVTRE